MTLYFITTTFNEVPWNVGKEIPEGLNIREIQADGQELILIRSLSEKIPRFGSNMDRKSRGLVSWNAFDASEIYRLLLRI